MVKKWFYVGGFVLVLFLGIIDSKEIEAAGTCTCSVNGSTRLMYVSADNCESDEYATGCEGTSNTYPIPNCVCTKKATTGVTVNTCTCNGSGTILTDNCQGTTSVPYCNLRGAVCVCTKNGTIESNYTEAKSTSTSTGDCVDTALGCVPYTVKGFSTWLLQILFGIAGGIAFLLMVYGFILMGTSSGDEKKLQGAKETITSAITGLLVSIFALFIFRLIAVDILKIPGLSGSSNSGGSTTFTSGTGTTHGGRSGSF